MNIVILSGRLTRDPEIRYTNDKKPVCAFTLAVDDGKSENGRRAQFISCVAWERWAEILDQYFKKGDGVSVTGKTTSRSYEKDGKKHYVQEVRVGYIEFPITRKSDDENQTPVSNAFSDYEDDDGELPF